MFPDGIHRPIEVLLVEDNAADALLAREALALADTSNNVYHVVDGVEAMAFLRREGEYADMPCPDIILLDINLPRMDGHEVLAEVKTAEELKHIPVIMLSTSDDARDIQSSYRNYANSYITKPGSFLKLANVLSDLGHYWENVAVLPEPAPSA